MQFIVDSVLVVFYTQTVMHRIGQQAKCDASCDICQLCFCTVSKYVAVVCGQVNLLVSTDVVEEGLDVQSCRSVIRFDLSKTVRSYIQSRGRARHTGSEFIVFMERLDQSYWVIAFLITVSDSKVLVVINLSFCGVICRKSQGINCRQDLYSHQQEEGLNVPNPGYVV